MEKENLSCVPVSENDLETQIALTELQINGSNNPAFDEITLKSENAFSLPDNIYRSSVSNCTGDIQLGTRIVTPNVFVLDPNKESLNHIEKIIKGGDNDYTYTGKKQKDYNLTSEDISNSVKKRAHIKVVHVSVVIVATITVTLILLVIINNIKLLANSTSETKNSLNKSWFFTQTECGGKQGEFCDSGNLTAADGIKISYTSNPCNTFNSCCESLMYEKRFDISCRYEDIHYHFTMSELGEIYEGRRTECQIPLTYRNCDQSPLEIGIFTGREGIVCSNIYKVSKQIESLNKLIKYNQDKNLLPHSSLSLYFSETSYRNCTEVYLEELKKTFDIQKISYYNDSFCLSVCP